MHEDQNTKKFNEDVGNYLRSIRHNVGESLESSAALSGLSKGTIYLFETGKRTPRLETLIKLCDAYGFSYKEFFGNLGKVLDDEKEKMM